jgi:hypothetical protein
MTDDKIKLGVLWKQVSREGNKPYLSGRVDQDGLDAAVALLRRGGRFLVLSNKKRPEKRDPDCVLFVVPEKSATARNEPNSSPRRKDASPGPFE